MSSKLTKTEELAAKLYFNEGLKPKEIAQKLGISVNTVYKAISKYRAFTKNVDQSLNQVGNDRQMSNSPQVSDSPYVLSNYGGIFNVSLSIISGLPVPQSKNDFLYEDTYQGELIKELKSLKELIGKLIEKVEELEKKNRDNSCLPNFEKGQDYVISTNDKQPSDDSLPEFIRDNPWIDVIKSIHST
ncbi:helix-turn-helix domain-containing protein [Vulcanisaeta sp. JCM 16159]|uniref:helix-turn-helix domain-containing protein n=1 Tax=Vulcanisaeta sp. JCM 16159 TaxID=1295371 RepID=UPI0006D1CA7D|nr:helix-turn-helix domain-containing protein [Vulcanisaeta sp. JCM 16159]